MCGTAVSQFQEEAIKYPGLETQILIIDWREEILAPCLPTPAWLLLSQAGCEKSRQKCEAFPGTSLGNI